MTKNIVDKNVKYKVSPRGIFSKIIPIPKDLIIIIYTLLINTIYSLRAKMTIAKWSKLKEKATAYYNKQNYDSAIFYIKQSLELLEKKAGVNNWYYVSSLINLGSCYTHQARYDKAELTLLKALEIAEKGSNEYYAILLSLGTLYFSLKEYKKSEDFYLKAMNYYRRFQQSDGYQVLSHNLYELYLAMGQNEKAGFFLNEYEDSIKRIGAQDIDDVICLIQKASQLLANGELQEAEVKILEAIKYFRQVNRSDFQYTKALNLYAEILCLQKRFIEAKANAEEIYNICCNIYGKESENTYIALQNMVYIDIDLGAFEKAEERLTRIIERFSNPVYKSKSHYVHSMFILFKLYCEKKDFIKSDILFPELIKELQNYYTANFSQFDENERLFFYGQIYSYNISLYSYLIIREFQNSSLLKAIFNFRLFSKGLLLKEFGHGESTVKEYTDIQKEIKENEAAIEIVRINQGSNVCYIFMIVTKDTLHHPYITYFSIDDLQEKNVFHRYSENIRKKSIDMESYKKLWKCVEEFVKDKSIIYISADGIYKQININNLFTPEGKFIIEDKEILYVDDFNLYNFNRDKNNFPKSASLFGNPNFSLSENTYFPRLDATENEITSIKDILEQNNCSVKSYLRSDATKQNFLDNLHSEMLHIATHGYYEENSLIDIDSTMENSCFLLANSISASGNEIFAQKDGIVTAREIKHLNLSHIKLVIISGCNTGIGKLVMSGDSFGLQRAFLIARVKSMIVSLYKIPDEATKDLMIHFYINWFQTGDKAKAFRNAQLCLKEKYRYPFYWGGFILINN